MALKLPWLLISVSEWKFSKWYKLSIEQFVHLFCPLLKTELVHTVLWTHVPVEQDAQLWRNCYRSAGAAKGQAAPEDGDLSFTGPKCKQLPTTLYAKIQIPCSRHAFFSPQVCKGQAVSRCLPTCPFPITIIRLCCPGAFRDGVRSCGVASSLHRTGTAVLSPPLLAHVVRLAVPFAMDPDQILKSDAFRHA